MSGTHTVGAVTVGNSPRDDLIPEIKQIASLKADILQKGALDGLSMDEIRKLAPEQGDGVTVSLLKDGSFVKVGKPKLAPRLQMCINSLVDEGAKCVVLLCTGMYPTLTCPVTFIAPWRIFRNYAIGLAGQGRRLGLMKSAPEQVEGASREYLNDQVDVQVVSASPYAPDKDAQVLRAAKRLKELVVDIVMMGCPGYNLAMKRKVESITEKPVILGRSVIAWSIKELAE